MNPPTSHPGIHLVLSAGGVKTISYIGVLQALEEKGIPVLSVSCSSAGSIVGALYATGVPLAEIEKFLVKTSLRKLRGSRTFPFLFNWLSWLRYPYAAFDSDKFTAFIQEILPKDATLGDMKIHFSIVAIDLYRSTFVVYSSTTHKDMLVSDSIRVATIIPGMWAPYSPDSDKRVIIDGGVATLMPAWLAPNFGADEPILVLNTISGKERKFKSNLLSFIKEMIEASSQSWDRHLIESNPRVQVLDIDTLGIHEMQVHISNTQKLALIDQGRDALIRKLPELLDSYDKNDHRSIVTLNDAWSLNPSTVAEANAKLLKGQYIFSGTSERSLLYISYAPEDEDFFQLIRSHLEPMARRINLQVWSDLNIPVGKVTEEGIRYALDKTRIALLLVSADYFNNDNVQQFELPYFQNEKHNVDVLWLPVSSVDTTDLSNFPCAVHPDKPLDLLSKGEQNRVLSQLATRLVTYLNGK
ncbi:MAG: patatin-like phospholipase family protein [Saprospiraceae bacterium]|nr:patatin-like phospholipase family protein [Saprospiraceae bacterium]